MTNGLTVMQDLRERVIWWKDELERVAQREVVVRSLEREAQKALADAIRQHKNAVKETQHVYKIWSTLHNELLTQEQDGES